MIRIASSVFLILCTSLCVFNEVHASQTSRARLVLSEDISSLSPQADQKEKQDKKSSTKQDKAKKPDADVEIKQVPKSKRQAKPAPVKPVVKVKTIKIVRPKIKKP